MGGFTFDLPTTKVVTGILGSCGVGSKGALLGLLIAKGIITIGAKNCYLAENILLDLCDCRYASCMQAIWYACFRSL